MLAAEHPSQSKMKDQSAIILKHLIHGIKDEHSFHFAVVVFNALQQQLYLLKSQDFNIDPIDMTANLDQAFQALFVCNVWKEWNMKQWLSAKQLFVVIHTLGKDKSAKYLRSSSVIEIIEYAFGSICDSRLQRTLSFDKFLLIPCINYLAFQEQERFAQFGEYVERIDFQSDKVQSVNVTDFTEALIFDLQLRKDKQFSPKVWIEQHLLRLLRRLNDTNLTKGTLDLLLDNNNYAKDEPSNPWIQLWSHETCWDMFQELYKTEFAEWNKLIEKLQQCVVKFEEISKKLLQGFQSSRFLELVMQSTTTIYEFLQFVHKQDCMYVYVYPFFFFATSIGFVTSNRWKDRNSVTRTIGAVSAKRDMSGEGLALSLELLWSVTVTRAATITTTTTTTTTMMTVMTSEKDVEKRLTNEILQLLLTNEQARPHWIALLAKNWSDSTTDHDLSEALEQSFCSWLGEKDKKCEYDEIPFHSKVLELVSCHELHDAQPYCSKLIESLKDRSNELCLNSDQWKSDQIRAIHDCSDVKSDLWEALLSALKEEIPSNMEQLNDINVVAMSNILCQNLDYCLKCRLWFQQDNPIQESLFKFLNQLLANLIQYERLLPVHVYKYLTKHLQYVQGLCSSVSWTDWKESTEKLKEMVRHYEEFCKLLRVFRQTITGDLFDHNLTPRLAILRNGSDTWETQAFFKTKSQYEQEIKQLKEIQPDMEKVMEQSKSSIFRHMWNDCCTTNQKMRGNLLVVFKKVFQDTNENWEHFKQVLFFFFFFKKSK
ncbi:hypothetical protein RFI_01100 [Reticulomyxa filosa]|uniref:Uncharacterized protein n=1 Tax=Reticulomyxa filosa TaxID=46433 RepID=X6PD26_RETFI|nr:hypothetical protein RFI_01100 [Reticulomyxa filosa]|eukprot:ETO35959.1 hypothetical protein RFI_01100 [Reticulomyxa filosa]